MSPPSDANAAPHSPPSFPLSDPFSEDDIQQLLGAMHGYEGLIQSEQRDDQDETLLPASSAGSAAVGSPGYLQQTDEQDDIKGEGTSCTTRSEAAAIPEEVSSEARAQRKRCREKQRRSDTNKHFSDLTVLLQRIETEDLGEDGRLSSCNFGPMNRVDLIARTIGVLERMRDASKKRKTQISDLQKQVQEANQMAEHTAARLKEATLYQQGPPKPVMMMVPMMVSPDGMTTAGAPAAPFSMAAPTHFMPQPFMSQPAAGTAPLTTAGTSSGAVTTSVATAAPGTTTMMAMPPMMFNAAMQHPMTTPVIPTPGQATATTAPVPGQTKQQLNMNSAGGNLAHCA